MMLYNIVYNGYNYCDILSNITTRVSAQRLSQGLPIGLLIDSFKVV